MNAVGDGSGLAPRPFPPGAQAPAAFALKVDVDTYEGLVEGVPRLLELFARHGVRASWFVAMGPDRTGRAVLRVFRQRGFLAKMLRSGAPRLYSLRTMLRGTLLPAVPIAAGAPGRLREIAAAGHELGVHGYDHVHWHDDLRGLPEQAVRAEVERACQLFEQILGTAPLAFAAPGWQCTRASLQAIDERGFRYRSDTRGRHPYRPRADGYLSSIPELPTTLPTLDEMLGREGRSVDELTDFYLRRIPHDCLTIHTVHTEIEGGPCLAHLDRLLTRVRERLPVRPLGEIAAALPTTDLLPISEVEFARLPGRGGEVACQADASGPTRLALGRPETAGAACPP
jgi:undecaprenyl phosphate-alpha-L-ara4FN deformylase